MVTKQTNRLTRLILLLLVNQAVDVAEVVDPAAVVGVVAVVRRLVHKTRHKGLCTLQLPFHR